MSEEQEKYKLEDIENTFNIPIEESCIIYKTRIIQEISKLQSNIQSLEINVKNKDKLEGIYNTLFHLNEFE